MAAKKTTTKASTKSPATKADKAADTQPAATPVVETRFSNVPPTKAPRPITEDDIRTHAYFISISGQGGSEFDNWCRAENELRSL